LRVIGGFTVQIARKGLGRIENSVNSPNCWRYSSMRVPYSSYRVGQYGQHHIVFAQFVVLGKLDGRKQLAIPEKPNRLSWRSFQPERLALQNKPGHWVR
jgi:hypothetical protein